MDGKYWFYVLMAGATAAATAVAEGLKSGSLRLPEGSEWLVPLLTTAIMAAVGQIMRPKPAAPLPEDTSTPEA